MNSKRKGKTGELELSHYLSSKGFASRRTQQYCGTEGNTDLVSELPYHIECKRVERFNIRQATAQAERDSNGQPWIVFTRWNNGEWLVVLKADEFLREQ